MADADFFGSMLERYQKAQKSNPLTDLLSMFGGPETQGDVMREVQRTAPLMQLEQSRRSQRALELKEEAETRKAATEQQKQTMEIFRALKGQVDDFHKLPEDIQAVQRPARIKEFKLFSKALGNPYDDTDAEAFFTTPGYADKLMATTDPIMPPEKRTALRTELGGAATAEQRASILDRYNKRSDDDAMDFVRQALQLIPTRFPGKENIPVSEIRAMAKQEFPELSKSPAVRRAFEAALSDNNLMAQYKVQAPSATLAGQTAEATALGGLTPAVTEGKAKQAAAVQGAEIRAGLAPDIKAAQLAQKAAETEAVEAIKAKYAKKVQLPGLTNQLRDDFMKLPSVRTFEQASGVFSQMEEAFNGPHTTAADWAILVSYAKMVDPDSVAREGEQAAVKALAARDDQARNAYDLILRNKLFTPTVRKEIYNAAGLLLDGRATSVKEREETFKGIAKRQGVSEADSIVDVLGRYRNRPKEAPTPVDPVKDLKDELRGRRKDK